MGLTLDPRDMLGSPDMQLPWRGKWYVDSTDSLLVLLALKPRVKIKCYDCFFALVTVRTKRQSRGPAFPLIHPTSPVKKMQFSVLFRIVPQHRKTNTFWVPRTQTPSTDSTRIRDPAKNQSWRHRIEGEGGVDWTSCCSYVSVPILSPSVWPMDFLQSIQGRAGRHERFQNIATGFGRIGIAVSLLHLSIIWYTFSHSTAMRG